MLKFLLPLTLLLAFQVHAQSYPSRPIRLVHGFGVGSAIDVMGRPLAAKLTDVLGQQVIVDARPGATGGIANEFVAKSVGDGYTLLTAPGRSLTASPHLQAVRFDPLRDFAPIVQTTAFSYVLVAHPALPVTSMKDFIALARAKPGAITYGTAGAGSNPHIAGELFNYLGKTSLVAVHFKGGGPGLIAAMSGEVTATFTNIAETSAFVRAKKLRAIGISSLKRSPAFPEIPTVDESGLKGYEAASFTGILAPTGTPKPVLDRLYEAVVKTARLPTVTDRFKELAAALKAPLPGKAEALQYADMTNIPGVALPTLGATPDAPASGPSRPADEAGHPTNLAR